MLKITIQDLLKHLDGNGLIITDQDLIDTALKEISLDQTKFLTQD
jgi:hypothetical protein